MRIAEYKQVSTRLEQRVIHHAAEYAEDGSITAEAWDETVEVQVPVMGTIYRDATPEEEAEFERQRAEMQEPEPTPEERLDQVEAVSDMAYINSELALAILEEMEV
ncbi:MAG: hypothetical protein ACI4WX_06235 [Aristaeellaceae bacterium]